MFHAIDKILALFSVFNTSYCTERFEFTLRTQDNRHPKLYLADLVHYK